MAKQRSQKSRELHQLLLKRGYPIELAEIIADNLNTDYTAQRMLGYLYYFQNPRLEDLADEMISILNDRELLIEKHENTRSNIILNDLLNNEFEE